VVGNEKFDSSSGSTFKIKKMIKVFTTNHDAKDAGDELTLMFENWKSTLEKEIVIQNIHSTSNNYGWMLVITYRYL